jgi:hypothetical protein
LYSTKSNICCRNATGKNVKIKHHGSSVAVVEVSGVLPSLFVLRVFREMSAVGYDVTLSARMVAIGAENTWVFKKNEGANGELKEGDGVFSGAISPPSLAVCLVGHDSLRVVGCGKEFNEAKDVAAVRAAARRTWGAGAIVEEARSQTGDGEAQTLLRLGRFCLPRAERKTSTTARSSTLSAGGPPRAAWLPPVFLFRLVASLAEGGYRLRARTGVHGRASALFFARDQAAAELFGTAGLHGETNIGVMSVGDQVIRLTRSMEAEAEAVRTAIKAEQHVTATEGFRNLWMEFTLPTEVFSRSPSASVAQKTHAVELVCACLDALWERGWRCKGAADYSPEKRSAFFFHRGEPGSKVRFAAITFTSGNKVRMVNFPSGTAWVMTQVMRESYQLRSKEVREDNLAPATTPTLKLDGYPFDNEYAKGALPAKQGLVKVAAEIGRRGWRPVAAADVCGTWEPDPDPQHPPRSTDAQTIFFVKENWSDEVEMREE